MEIHENCKKCIYLNKAGKCWAIRDYARYGADGCDFREEESACSAPAGGSTAAGEGQVAHSPDGDGLKSKGDSKLMKKFEVDGAVYDIPEPVDAYIKGLVKTLRYTLDKNDEAYHILSGSNDNLRDAFLGIGIK